jgi:Flp pilus assembly protein TadD
VRADRNLPEAQTMAQRALDLERTAPHYYLLAVTCLKNKDHAGALEAIKQAVTLNPSDKRYQQFLQQLQRGP